MIYFVLNKRCKAVKIGYSSDVRRRFSSLQTSSPGRLRLLGVCPGMVADEGALHQQFAHLHLRGEWFHASRELLTAIAELTKGHRLHGRCLRCGITNVELCEDSIGVLLCKECAAGVPLHRSRRTLEPFRNVPAGGGYWIIRKPDGKQG